MSSSVSSSSSGTEFSGVVSPQSGSSSPRTSHSSALELSPIPNKKRSSFFEEMERLDELSGEDLSPKSFAALVGEILLVSADRPISQPPSPRSFQSPSDDALSSSLFFLKNVCNFLENKNEFLYQKEVLDDFINEISEINWSLKNKFPELLEPKLVELVESNLVRLFDSKQMNKLETHVPKCPFKKRVFKLLMFRENIEEIGFSKVQEVKIRLLPDIISQLIEGKYFKTAIKAAKRIPDCQVKWIDNSLYNPKREALGMIRNAAFAEKDHKSALKAQNAMPSMTPMEKITDFKKNFELEIRVIGGKLKVVNDLVSEPLESV